MKSRVNGLKRILYILIQCTWGLSATLVGLGFFIANRKHEHHSYRCCIDTNWDYCGGLSLGFFIFTPKNTQANAPLIRVHEYGHTIQNLVLGPFMLIAGIISVVWGNNKYFARMRSEQGVPYTACFVEWWASKWGEIVTGEKAIWK